MKLGHVNICFLAGTLGQGGAERQLFLLCGLLKEAGATVRVLSLTRGEFWEEPLSQLGVPVRWVGRAKSKPGRILAIRKALKEIRPQICQSQHFFANLYVHLACKGLGILDLGAVRSNIHQEMASRNKLICNWSLKRPRFVLANSRQAIKAAEAYGQPPSRMRYLPNIINPDDFPRVAHTEKKRYQILGVGRLVALKHWHIFLEVIADLKQRALPVRGVLVGDGPLRQELQSHAADLKLGEKDLQWAGTAADVKPYYAASDLLLATSSLEGMPNVVMEAMACGLPVVSTRVGGVVDLLGDGDRGMIAEVDETGTLSEHCTKLLGDLELRRQMGRDSRTFLDSQHSPQAVLKQVAGLYEEFLV